MDSAKRIGMIGVVLAASAVGFSQVASAPGQSTVSTTLEVGGRTGFELITIDSSQISIALQHGHLMRGSESLDLDGRSLVRNKDYTIDLATGSLVLLTQVNGHASLRVQYRYDDKQTQVGSFIPAGPGSIQGFALGPGATFSMGFGLAERLADGTTMNNQVFGIANTLNISPTTTLTGLLMIGNRQRSRSVNLFDRRSKGASLAEEGQGTAIVQNFATRFMGGEFQLGYQSIDEHFGGFSSFASVGYDQSAIEQLAKEKGLKRTSLSMTNVKVGGFAIDQGLRKIGDDSGSVTWRDGKVSLGGLTTHWSSQYVDPGFTRFGDLREKDRDQLAKEKGLLRQNYGASQQALGGMLSFEVNKIEADGGSGIYRQAMRVDLPGFMADFKAQRVGDTFSRFTDLREEDRNQLSREKGLSRQDITLKTTALSGVNLGFSSNRVTSEQGDLKGLALSLGTKVWSFEHNRQEADKGFLGFSALSEPEIQGRVAQVAHMYTYGANPVPQDYNGWANWGGLNRSNMRAKVSLGGASFFEANQVDVSSLTGDLRYNTFAIAGTAFSLNYVTESVGDQFKQGSSLMSSEQTALSPIDGYQKSQLSLDAKLGGQRSLSFDRLLASDLTGGAFRQILKYSDKNFSLNYTRRNVGTSFTNAGGINDTEHDLLRSLLGFDQTEIIGAWQLFPSLRIEKNLRQEQDFLKKQTRMFSNQQAIWSLDGSTSLNWQSLAARDDIEGGAYNDSHTERMGVKKAFGKLGTVAYSEERTSYDAQTNAPKDSQTKTVSYETQITKATGIRTEQSQKIYADGSRETTNSNTVSTALNDRVGVSLTNTRTDRPGENADETKRNYGFWVDFGKGIKLKMGYARQLQGEKDGTMTSETSLSGGEFQGLKVNSATYTHNMWDDKRDQNFGNVSLANVKPLKWGFLSDVSFHYLADTAHDNDIWQKENRSMGWGGSIGRTSFGYDYNSQIGSTGYRAIDRIVSFNTDKTGQDRYRASFKYGVRTLPTDESVMVRDYSLAIQPSKNLVFSHSMTTNLLTAKPDALLGSTPVDERKNTWMMKVFTDPKFSFDASWSETLRDDPRTSLIREAKINITLFANNPSPLNFSYGLQQADVFGIRQTAHKFGFGYTQRSGPNQSFGLLLENLNWEHGRPVGSNLQNWNLRLDFSAKL